MDQFQIQSLCKLLGQKRISGVPYTTPYHIAVLKSNQISHEITDGKFSLDKVVSHSGFETLGESWTAISIEKAHQDLLEMFRFFPAYNSEHLTVNLAKKALELVMKSVSPEAVFYTSICESCLSEGFHYCKNCKQKYLTDYMFERCVGIVDIKRTTVICQFDYD